MNRELARPVQRPLQGRVGDVRNGGEQEKQDGSLQSEEQCFWREGARVLLDECPDTVVGGRVLTTQTLRDHLQLSEGALPSDAVRESTEYLQRPRVAGLRVDSRHRTEGLPNVRNERKPEAFGHDADDRCRRAVHADAAPNNVRLSAITPLPYREPDDDDRDRSRLVIGYAEAATKNR